MSKKYCLTHDSYDSDGDGNCGVFDVASPYIKQQLDPCELVLTACPECGSDEGFRMCYGIEGHGYEDRDFKNGIIDADKHEVHDVDRFVTCLSCGELISTEDVRTE